MKPAARFAIAWAILSVVWAQGATNNMEGVGDSYVPVSGELSARKSATIANTYYEFGGGPGTVVDNVNVVTGQPTYSVPIGNISLRGISYPLVLQYGGSIRPSLEGDNSRAPTSMLGLGWGMELPFVAVNHKGTVKTDDDVIECHLGPFGGGQILQRVKPNCTSNCVEWFLSSNPAVTVKPVQATSDQGTFQDRVSHWEITLPNGLTFFMGESQTDATGKIIGKVDASERTVLIQNGNVAFEPDISWPVSETMIYRWDVKSISDFNKKSSIVFEWEKQELRPGFTRSSRVKRIYTTGPDENGDASRRPESWDFTYGTKNVAEYRTSFDALSIFDQRPWEDFYLSKMEHRLEGNVNQTFTFRYHPQLIGAIYKKRLLDGIDIANARANGTGSVQRFKWDFTYEDAKDFLLSKVTHPDKGSETFSYVPADLGIVPPGSTLPPQMKQDTKVYDMQKWFSTLTGSSTLNDRWTNESVCDERFCYLITRVNDGRHDVFLNIVHNNGHYSKAGTDAVFTAENDIYEQLDNIPYLDGCEDQPDGTCKPIKPLRGQFWERWWRVDNVSNREGPLIQIIPRGDDFLVVHRVEGRIEQYSWDPANEKFVKKQDIDNLPVWENNGCADTHNDKKRNGVEVIPAKDYLLLVFNGFLKGFFGPGGNADCSKMWGNPRETYIMTLQKNHQTGLYEAHDAVPHGACGALYERPEFGEDVTPQSFDGCNRFTGMNEFSVGDKGFTLYNVDKDILYTFVKEQQGNLFKVLGAMPCLNPNENLSDPNVGHCEDGGDRSETMKKNLANIAYHDLWDPSLQGQFGYNNNLNHHYLLGMTWASDYLVLLSGRVRQNPNNTHFDLQFQAQVVVLQLAGDRLRMIGQHNIDQGWRSGFFEADPGDFKQGFPAFNEDYETWTENGYFLVKTPVDHKLFHYQIGGGVPSTTFVTPHELQASPEDANDADMHVRTYPNLFTVEYYNNDDLKFHTVPINPPKVANNQYRSFIFMEDKETPKEVLFTNPEGIKVWDVNFMPGENILTGKISRLKDDITKPCPPNSSQECQVDMMAGIFDSYKDTPTGSLTPPPVRNVHFVKFNQPKTASDPIGYSTKFKTLSFSPGGRFAMTSMLNLNPQPPTPGGVNFPRFQYQLYFWNGENYLEMTTPPWVVSSVTRDAGLDDQSAKNKVVSTFDYNPVAEMGVFAHGEFNAHTRLPMFGSTKVSRAGHGSQIFAHHILSLNIGGTQDPALNAAQFEVNDLTGAGKLVRQNHLNLIAYPPKNTPAAQLPPWPPGMQVIRAQGQVTTAGDVAGNKISVHRDFKVFDDKANAPLYVVETKPDAPVLLQQQILEPVHKLPQQEITYKLASAPTDAQLTAKQNDPFQNTGAIASSKRDYTAVDPSLPQTNYLVKKTHQWRHWPDMQDADLINGDSPDFDLNQGWEETSEVTLRNGFDQPEEVRIPVHSGTDGDRYTSSFYEGRRSDQVGVVQMSRLRDCAILTAENGPMNPATLDNKSAAETRWEAPGATLSSEQAHTGRYSVKVVDNFGPTINLKLKDAVPLQYGYIVSAWVLATPGTTPILKIERRSKSAPNVVIDAKVGAVVNEAFTANKWQRWEATVSFAELTAGGLFSAQSDNLGDPNDFLRVWIGTGNPSSTPSKVLYVDDIVCRPSIATFSTTAYDFRGLPASTIDTYHRLTSTERNALGEVVGVRDSRGRIFEQTGKSLMGEAKSRPVSPGRTTIVRSPIGDLHVRDGSNATTFYGASPTLEAKSTTAGSGYNRIAYFMFDISNLPDYVSNAKLRVYAWLTEAASITSEVHEVSNVSWTEMTVNWNNKPALGNTISSLSVTGTAPQWYEYDVTRYVQSARASGATKVSLAIFVPGDVVPATIMNSKQAASNQPELTLNTEEPQVLFVTGGGTLSATDAAVKARLEALGLSVTVGSDATATAADAAGKALVILSKSVTSGTVGSKFTNVEVPVLNYESDLQNDLKMTGSVEGTDWGTRDDQTQIKIQLGVHPLAAGLSGTQTIYSSAGKINWGKPSSSAAKVISKADDASFFPIYGYEKGASMVGLIAPARRVQFFLTENEGPKLTTTGWKLFDAAVAWAMGDSKYSALFVVGNTSLNVGDAAVKSRLESLGFNVLVKDASATAPDADGKTLVVISSTVASAAVNTKFRNTATPVLTWEEAIQDDMGMTSTNSSDHGTSDGKTTLHVKFDDHPLASALTGAQVVTSSPQTISWGIPNANAAKVFSKEDDGLLWPVYGYEKGASMVGLTAPARRTMLFLADETAASLTSVGWELVDAAVLWTAGQ